MLEERNPAFSGGWRVCPFGKKAGFPAHSQLFVLYTDINQQNKDQWMTIREKAGFLSHTGEVFL